VAQGVRTDRLVHPGTAGDPAHDPRDAVPVHPLPVRAQEDRPVEALADGQIDRASGAGRERDGHDLAHAMDSNVCSNSGMRWQLADQADGDQPGLFGLGEIVGPEKGTGRLSGLEFLPVLARTILNRLPSPSPLPYQWSINAYRGCSHACTYCFARPTHEYLGLDAGADFDHKIVVKINAVERLRAELADPGWMREPVAMGTNTDPYQRAEGKYRLTRGIIGELVRARTPFSILTKSALVTRDLDLLVEAGRHVEVSVSFSIGTLDSEVWRAAEPGTPHPRRRLDAMRAMSAAGIRTGALVAPVLPGLSDSRAQLTETIHAILDAGGAVLGFRPLYLRGPTRDHFLRWLAGHDPALHKRYVHAYGGRIELGRDYHEWLQAAVRTAIASHSARPGTGQDHLQNKEDRQTQSVASSPALPLR
jgi:DNA repair photolyase